MDLRDRIAIISIPVIMLGVMSLFVFLVGTTVEYFIPGSLSSTKTGSTETVLVVIGIFVALSVGLYLGIAIWLLCMKPFFNREELLPYVSRPHIPIVTPSILVLFNLLYSNR